MIRVFLFGLYEQLNSHFPLWKFNAKYKPSIDLVPADKKLGEISSLIKALIPPPCWSRSRRKVEKVSKNSKLANWKQLTEICFWNNSHRWSTGKSNLFLNELILRWPKTIFRRFFLQISFKFSSYESLSQIFA